MKKPRVCKHGDYEKKIVFPVWSNYVVHVVFTNNLASSYYKRYHREREFIGTHAFHAVSHNPGGHAHLFFKIGDSPAGVVAHECWHAVRELLNYGGVEQLDNEMIAYHLGYLVQQASNFLYELIDSGVKSNDEVKPNERSRTAQRGTTDVRGLQPNAKGKKGTQTAQDPKGSHAGPVSA